MDSKARLSRLFILQNISPSSLYYHNINLRPITEIKSVSGKNTEMLIFIFWLRIHDTMPGKENFQLFSKVNIHFLNPFLVWFHALPLDWCDFYVFTCSLVFCLSFTTRRSAHRTGSWFLLFTAICTVTKIVPALYRHARNIWWINKSARESAPE